MASGQAAARPRRTGIIQSVERVGLLLSLFTPDRPSLTLSELAEGLGLGKATTHRYAMSLRRTGLLRFEPATGTLSLGPRVLELGSAAQAGFYFTRVAAPYMDRLCRELDETIVLSVWDGQGPVLIRAVDSTQRLVRISVRLGSRLSLASAQGSVFLSHGAHPLSAEGGPAKERLDEVRRAGIAVVSHVMDGIRTVACPVFDQDEMIAAMAVVGTTATIPRGIESPLARALKRTTGELSTDLGRIDGDRSPRQRRQRQDGRRRAP